MNREDRFYDLMEENTDDAGIQYEIGLCYLNGDGTEKDTAEAEKWLTRAANQGHEQAKALLESGNHDTPEKPAETDILELCMKAEDGDKDAQYAAARYFMAHGMAQSEADRYLKAAADQGNGQACDELGESLLQQSMNCANQNDRFEKEKQAVRYFKNALDCGIPHAAERLADCYLNARGTLQNDPEQAEAYFVKAAELYAQQGKPMALIELAERYAVGNGVPESYGKALSYVKRAQNAGEADAMEQFSSDVENYRAAQQRDAEEKERQRQEAEAVKQREAEEKEQQRQADKAENQKRYDEIQQELQEWENKLQELRVTRAQSQKFERENVHKWLTMPHDISTPPGKAQRTLLVIGAVVSAISMLGLVLLSFQSGNGTNAVIISLCEILSGIFMFKFWREGSIRRYISEFIFLFMTLMFWGVLLPQDPDADNVGMMMLAWAFVILLAMLWNIFQTVQKSRNLKNHSANVDRNNQLKQLLNTQIKEAQERISALQQEMQTILNDL